MFAHTSPVELYNSPTLQKVEKTAAPDSASVCLDAVMVLILEDLRDGRVLKEQMTAMKTFLGGGDCLFAQLPTGFRKSLTQELAARCHNK